MTYNICYLLIYISEAIIFTYYCSNLRTDKTSKLGYHFLVILMYTILFLLSFLRNPFVNTGFFMLFNFLFLLLMVKTNWTSALFHTAIITSAMGLSEVVIFAIFSSIPNDIFNQLLNPNKVLLLSILSKLLYFIVVYVISHIFLSNNEEASISMAESIFLSAVPFLSVFIILTFIVIQSIDNISSAANMMLTISALSLLIINIIIFSLYEYRNKKNRELTELKLLSQKEYDSAEYYKMLLKQDENQKILIHDIKKHLNAIALLNEQNSPDRVQSYIEHLLEFSDFKSSVRICNNDLLNAILCKYKSECEALNISISIDVRNNSIDFMEDSDISALFCNLMDNAIESASKAHNSFIDLSVIQHEGTTHTLITMENSCRINPFTNNSSMLKTTKRDSHRHGFGMKSIRKIVSKYKGDMSIYYDNEKTSFHTIIIIKNIK